MADTVCGQLPDESRKKNESDGVCVSMCLSSQMVSVSSTFQVSVNKMKKFYPLSEKLGFNSGLSDRYSKS